MLVIYPYQNHDDDGGGGGVLIISLSFSKVDISMGWSNFGNIITMSCIVGANHHGSPVIVRMLMMMEYFKQSTER